VHDLQTITALGGTTPRIDTFDHITISENDGLALATVAARLGQEDALGHVRRARPRDGGPVRASVQHPDPADAVRRRAAHGDPQNDLFRDTARSP